jgi:hypothetical protein
LEVGGYFDVTKHQINPAQAKKMGQIEIKLETEFDMIRKSRAVNLNSTDDGDEGMTAAVVLGDASIGFKFSQLGASVQFVELKRVASPTCVALLCVTKSFIFAD